MEEGWECVESCPIRLLDEMSGERGSTYRPSGSRIGHEMVGNVKVQNSKTRQGAGTLGYADKGGASKFFQTFPPEEEDNLIEPVQEVSSVQVINDDCLQAMRRMPESSIDSIVTDPPAGINFMNKAFDSDRGGRDQWIAWLEEIMAEALRVVKPGAHALVWALPRTSHWTATALENAGWEVRDRISHVFGSGFPKSANVEKLLTKAQGQKRRAHGMVPLENPQSARMHSGIGSAMKPSNEDWWLVRKPFKGSISSNILKYGEWLEDGTVYKVGTGGLNIDQSRVGAEQVTTHSRGSNEAFPKRPGEDTVAESGRVVSQNGIDPSPRTGRFPSNTLWSHVPGPNGCVRVGSRRVKKPGGNGEASKHTHNTDASVTWDTGQEGKPREWTSHYDPDGLEEVPEYICADSCAIRALDEMSGVSKSKTHKDDSPSKSLNGFGPGDSDGWKGTWYKRGASHTDSGTASRFFVNFSPDPNPGFFYSPKASKSERNLGLDGMPEKTKKVAVIQSPGRISVGSEEEGKQLSGAAANHHPCVKPQKLLEYLVTLVTPENGTVLDCFAGSGSTLVAAINKGFNAVGIEQDSSYVEICERRVAYALSEAKKGEVKTAKEWGLENVHPQDTPLRYNPDERPEEGGTFEPVEESWEGKRTGPEPDDLTYREVVEKFAAALAKTEEQFKDKLF